MDKDFISLKWGTLKSWRLVDSPASLDAYVKYNELGESFSAMAQNDTAEQKELICEMIDNLNGPIYNDWEGEDFESKEAAKKYVREYPR